MNKLDELSKISNAVLTPHLNCDLSKMKSRVKRSTKKAAPITIEEIWRIEDWCEKQLREIGSCGAVLSIKQ